MSIEIGDGGLGYIYLGDVLIAGKGGESGWKPGANTVAYYPLTSSTTTSDMSGNSRTLTNNGTTFGTYQGVNCAYLSNANSKKLYGNIPLTGNQTFTINLYIYWLGRVTSDNNSQIFVLGNTGSNNACLGGAIVDNTSLYKFWSWGQSDRNSTTTATTGTWAMFTLTNDTSTVKMYLNGSLIKQDTMSFNIGADSFTLGAFPSSVSSKYQQFYGYMSEVIIENKTWTATEISDYYNSTKSNYGL